MPFQLAKETSQQPVGKISYGCYLTKTSLSSPVCAGCPVVVSNFSIPSVRRQEAHDIWQEVVDTGGEASCRLQGPATKATAGHGLHTNHSYTVLAMCTVQWQALVGLRNPHGHGGKWHGLWGDSDPCWTTEAKSKSEAPGTTLGSVGRVTGGSSLDGRRSWSI